MRFVCIHTAERDPQRWTNLNSWIQGKEILSCEASSQSQLITPYENEPWKEG